MNDNTENETVEKEKTKIKQTTLGELGMELPIFQEGHDNLSFTFKDWDMETEELLSELQEKSKNVGAFVRQMMDLLLEDFCGKPWDSYKEAERIMLMTNLHFPNMIYMYIALRVEELGHELHFDQISCPNCKRPIENYVADLRTLQVDCKDKDGEFEFVHELKKPILLNGTTITELKCKVTQWGALEAVPSEKANNQASVKTAIFNSSIVGALNNGEPLKGSILLRDVVKKIKKYDIEKLQKAIGENNCGPDMVIGGTCPHCETGFIKPLEWDYESFFDSSSL